jgi:hypothetical protein
MYLRRFLIPALLGVALAAQARAEPQRQTVARSVGEAGTIMRRESTAKPWQLVGEGEALRSGDALLAGTGAGLDGKNGAVRLLLLGEAGGTPALPIIESAVVLHSGRDVDLDFALLRGRVDVVNRKAKGQAKVRVRGGESTADIRLLQPGARVALVLSGRWPPGVPFRKDAKPGKHKPALAFAVLVLRGEIELETAKHRVALRAPPGPALLDGDDIGDTDASPRRLDKLPAWATAKADDDDAKKVRAGLARFRELAREKSIPEALQQLLQSRNAVERRIAVALLGATDDLDRLTSCLTKVPTPDLWENSVGILRHWIGREPGQDQKLYQALIDKQQLTAAQAETVLHLLHGFGDDALTLPETYEGLLDLMESDQLAIRGLAHWHLYRLVPRGRKIGYDPRAAPRKRARAVQEWRKLIPAGKLPPSKET